LNLDIPWMESIIILCKFFCGDGIVSWSLDRRDPDTMIGIPEG
jgi:hypothetical protein